MEFACFPLFCVDSYLGTNVCVNVHRQAQPISYVTGSLQQWYSGVCRCVLGTFKTFMASRLFLLLQVTLLIPLRTSDVPICGLFIVTGANLLFVLVVSKPSDLLRYSWRAKGNLDVPVESKELGFKMVVALREHGIYWLCGFRLLGDPLVMLN